MKLEYLYYKEQLEEKAGLFTRAEEDQVWMTDEEHGAEIRTYSERSGEIREECRNRKGIYDEHALKIYRQILWETEGIAHDYGLDLKAEWNGSSGWIELAFKRILCESTANPLHLHLGLLFERCDSYSIMPAKRYGQELAALSLHFSFIYYSALDDPDER